MARNIMVNPEILALKADYVIDAFYLLKTASVKTSAKGSQYLALSLCDKSGEIEAKIWDYDPSEGLHEHVGEVIKVRGTVEEYNGKLQLKIENRRLPRPDDKYDMSQIVPTAPIDVIPTLDSVKDMLDGVQDKTYHAIGQKAFEVMKDWLRTLPAAKGVHHAFIAGLLMHTNDMMRDATMYADRYNLRYGDFINKDLLIVGTFCHDMAKRREFTTSGVGLVTEYSTEGQLMGHLVMGSEDIGELAKAAGIPVDAKEVTLLRHLILSHHGQREFGACVLPQTVEAEILSQVDMLNARIEVYREELPKIDVGTHSDFIKPLNHSIYRHM